MADMASARSPELELALSFQKELESAEITITDLKDQFLRKDFTSLTDSALSNNPTNPRIVAPDVLSQQSFLRKLKFHYIEQHAKDKYVKFIVSPDEPNIDAEDNERLKGVNDERKRLLKEDKVKLAETYAKIKEKAVRVDRVHSHAQNVTTEAATLTQKILDARLALTRLRAAHPAPRLTLATATQIADEQEEQMVTMDATLLELNECATEIKNRVKASVKEVDRLKVERAAKEEELKRTQRLEEDHRWPQLYDWYLAAASLHKSLMCLDSFETPSENELRLTYSLPKSHKATIILVFHPNTRRIAEANLVNSDVNIDIQELVGVHTTSNDVPDLLRAILARLRAAI